MKKTQMDSIFLLACLLCTGCAAFFRPSLSVEMVLQRTENEAQIVDQKVAEETRSEPGVTPRQVASKRQPAFQWPLRQISIRSGFGPRDGRPHQGVDLQASKGTPIYAAADGLVVLASDDIDGYGNTIIMRHPGGYSTVYGHLYDYLADRSDWIRKGQCIGYSGDSGRVTGPHLHFEIREGFNAVDPVSLLRIPGGKDSAVP